MATRSAKELMHTYSDHAWRHKFIDFFDLMEILGDCFISDHYTIPDDLNNAIHLSEAGKLVMSRLTRKEKVSPKEARLMCALSIGHEELFVDIDSINIDQLKNSIHTQLMDSSVRFPLVHGRELYDAYAKLYEDEKDTLNTTETQRLLDCLPTGVFQYGKYVIGPFGIHESLGTRSIESSRRVPAFHCERLTCHQVHSVILQTGDAPINKDRDKLTKYLQDLGQGSEWGKFAADLRGFKNSFFSDSGAGVILPLLGDALSDDELRMIVIELFNNTKGALRSQVEFFLKVQNAHETVKDLNRAQLLQIALLVREADLSSTLNRLVQSQKIEVPSGDVRHAVISRNRATGAFQLRAELGHYGVRFASIDSGHALLRLKQLLVKLYNLAEPSEIQELEWQLRELESADISERLETYFRSNSPEHVLRRLVLARRSNVVLACHELSIEDYDQLNDDELVSTLLWKLGFRVGEEADPHLSFWKRHEHLWALTQSTGMGQSATFLEVASPYFRDLEGLLLDSLAFTAWALTNDHSRAPQPFSYDNESDRVKGLTQINMAKQAVRPIDRKPTDYTTEKVDLHDLINGYIIFSEYLDLIRKDENWKQRAAEDFPEFSGKTDLKIFKFSSTIPFQNLSTSSQERVVTGLKEIYQVLTENEVTLVRNEYSHYRRNLPDIQRVEKAMDAIRSAVTKLENLGFCQMLFKPSNVTTDEWGHKKIQYKGPRSYQHTFTHPTPYDWMGLPELTHSQFLLRSAFFDGPNEVLRFTRRYQSHFSRLWEEYPNRRKKGKNPLSELESPEHKSEANVTET